MTTVAEINVLVHFRTGVVRPLAEQHRHAFSPRLSTRFPGALLESTYPLGFAGRDSLFQESLPLVLSR
jgi:hypothetical protein